MDERPPGRPLLRAWARRVLGWAVLGLSGAAGCGPELVERPLELELQGVSSRVETLVVKLSPPERGPACRDLDLASARALDGAEEARWRRSEGRPRQLDLPGLATAEVKVVVLGVDTEGRPVQLACAVYAHRDLERPERTLTLEMS